MIEVNLTAVAGFLVVVVISILTYFCKRMIDQNDDNFKSINSRFDKVDGSLVEVRNDIHKIDTRTTVLEEKVERVEDHCPLMVGKTP